MFKMDTSNIEKLERDLGKMAEKAIPFAIRNTLNKSAFVAREEYQDQIRENMVTRNKFTERSVRVKTTKSLNPKRMEAIVGSIADYMESQEFGDVKAKKGKEGVPIATSYAAGLSEQAKPRTRLPRKPNKMQNIILSKKRKGANRKQRNVIAVKEAAKSGQKYAFLDMGRTKGLFKVVGGKRRPRVKMVHDLSRTSVRIPRNPLLKPAVAATRPKMRGIHEKSLEFQAKRLGLFK